MLADDPGGSLVGRQIGPYEILSVLGEGGMGVVYRALDARLKRPVAIKFLSDELADPTARRRFQREAQMASALNHPHILTVHDTGEFDGRQYLVTELVDGGTLKDWARAEPRTWRQIVELLAGVADGLAAAHAAGILHRDIKPQNILIAKNGYAKLADFGLAKLEEHAASEEATRTLTEGRTRPGVVVGTVAYMSPEQASGRPVDARSDIFSFGVLLYELLAGRRPFTGATDLEVLKTIIHGAPQPLAEDVPVALRMAVEKALEKDPADRYQSMRDMVVDLRRLTRQTLEAAPASGVAPRLKRNWKWAAAATVIVLTVGAAGALFLFRSRLPAQPPPLEYTQLTNFADSVTSPALSPDGRMLAFIRGAETFYGPGEIYVKLLPDGEPVQVTHDGLEKMSPAFFPDGARIAYTGGDPKATRLPGWDTWSVPVLGGEPSRLLANAAALTWTESGGGPRRVLFSEWQSMAQMTVVASTETRADARTVYTPPSVNGMAHRAYLSPDRKSLLVVEMDGGWLPCRLAPYDGSSRGKLVGPSPGQCTTAAWSPDGKWMYFSANTGNGYHIWRQRFPGGAPEQVTFGATEEQGIAFAADGRSFVTSVGTRQSTLWVHDSRGEGQITSQGFAYLPSFSADGKTLFYLLRSRPNRRFVSGELWAANLETGQQERLLPDFLIEHYTVSLDGQRIVFVAVDDAGHVPVWLATLNGSSPPRRLTSIESVRTFFGASGQVFFMGGDEGRFLYRIKEDGTGLQNVTPDRNGYVYDVSMDGKFAAVMSGDSVVAYPVEGGSPITICTGCGGAGGENRGITPPVVSWSRDGKFLYLRVGSDNGPIWAVPLRPGQSLPPLPVGGIHRPEDVAAIPGARLIQQALAFAGANPSVYAFPRVTSQRNIYRIPVP